MSAASLTGVKDMPCLRHCAPIEKRDECGTPRYTSRVSRMSGTAERKGGPPASSNLIVHYDALGNIIEEGSNASGCGPHYTYKYDAENRIISVDDTGSSYTAKYKYDAFSRRVQKDVSASGTTDFYINLSGQIVGTMDASKAQVNGEAWAGDMHV